MHSYNTRSQAARIEAQTTVEFTMTEGESVVSQHDQTNEQNSDELRIPCTPTLEGLPFELQDQIFNLVLPDIFSVKDAYDLSNLSWRISCVMYSVVDHRIKESKRRIDMLEAENTRLPEERGEPKTLSSVSIQDRMRRFALPGAL
jgi:hypothetical protein